MGNRRTGRDPGDWIRIPCEPIIDLATFERAQKRMKHNKAYVGKRPSRTYLFCGMVFVQSVNGPICLKLPKQIVIKGKTKHKVIAIE